MVTSEAVWLADKRLLMAEGYRETDQEGPFSLRLKRFATAGDAGLATRSVELQSRDDVVTRSPTPHGTVGIVLDSRLLAHNCPIERELQARLAAAGT